MVNKQTFKSVRTGIVSVVVVIIAGLTSLCAVKTAKEVQQEGLLKFPKIDRRPEPFVFGRGTIKALPKYDANITDNPFQVDLRCYDLSKLDLKGARNDLIHSSFDDRTIWPGRDKMPENFEPKQIMEIGKNPGLGIRELHKKGITGRGVGIAILDQPLLVSHKEYEERLRLYEEIDIDKSSEAQMHGPGVASIAVGKTVGVAPEAELYYIANRNGDFEEGGKFTWNFEYLARGVNRILEINEQLPKDKKIRVISISVGWRRTTKGYKEISEATQKAKQAGMLVICSSVDEVHGFLFHGLGRQPLANPDDFNSYRPGTWWANEFYQEQGGYPLDRLLVPMDCRTTASQTSNDEYVFYSDGGWSWSIPYIAGVYALAAQVEPNVTPERFWALAMKTGRTIELENKGKKIAFGPILDAAKLIDALKSGGI